MIRKLIVTFVCCVAVVLGIGPAYAAPPDPTCSWSPTSFPQRTPSGDPLCNSVYGAAAADSAQRAADALVLTGALLLFLGGVAVGMKVVPS